MKLTFLTLIAVLLNCGNSIGFDLNQNGEVKTQIVDLDDDVLYMVFDRLEFIDLVKSAEAFPELSGIVSEVFRRKYSIYELQITLPGFPQRTNDPFIIEDNLMIVYDIQASQRVLKHFGNLVQTLSIIAGPKEASEVKSIYRLANEYCSESLKRLKLWSVLDNTLDEFTIPFKAVEEVICQFRMHVINETQPWNQLFPQLRRFTLYMYPMKLINANFIDCTFPHLEYLYLRSPGDEWAKHPEQIRGFFKKNPTIRSLELPFFVIKSISQHLPQLENLTLTGLHIENQGAQLESVKKFTLKYHYFPDSTIDKLSMPRLESLYTKYDVAYSNQWIAFFNNHTHLRQLHLSQCCDGRPVEINTLTRNLINLSDVTIEVQANIGADSIIEFVENHQKLNKFQLAIGAYRTDAERAQERAIFHERLGDEWNIEDFRLYYARGVSLEKKQPIVD